MRAESAPSRSLVGAHLRALPELFRVSFSRLVAYRAEMTIWILTATLPLIMLALWNTVAADGAIEGFGQVEIARYFVATLIVRQLTGAWIVWQLNWEIRQGSLSPRLLKPVHPLWQDVMWMFSALPFRVVILSPLLVALVLWRPELWQWPAGDAFALFVVSAGLAFALSYLVQAVFGILSFWLDQSMGLFGVWFGLYTVFSGYIAPLAFFPGWARDALWWLPFRAMLATPVELLGGFATPAEAAPAVLVQLGWTALFAILATVMWRRGLRRYGAFGA